MSRCLPFPPPNYMKNGVGGEALLTQLELERQKIESKKTKERRSRRKKNIEGHNEDEVEKKKCRKDDGRDKEDGNKSKNDDEKKERKLDTKNTVSVELEQPIIPPVNVCSDKRKGDEMADKYRKLFANWVPLPLHMVPIESIEDENWLLKKKKKKNASRKQTTTHDDTNNHSSINCNGIGMIYQGIQPRAHYLPDADINALPYVVPL